MELDVIIPKNEIKCTYSFLFFFLSELFKKKYYYEILVEMLNLAYSTLLSFFYCKLIGIF